MQFLRDAIRVISLRTTSTGAQNPIVVQNRRQSRQGSRGLSWWYKEYGNILLLQILRLFFVHCQVGHFHFRVRHYLYSYR